MTHSTSMAFAALLTLAASTAHANTELIVNGGFEADVLAANSWTTLPNITGWTGGRNGIELRNNVAGSAYEGHNFVELDTFANSSMWQEVKTDEGQHYILSFAYSPREKVGVASNAIEVYWNNSLVGLYSGKGNTEGSVWSTEKLELTGAAGASLLTFKAAGKSDSLGGSIDGVSLVSAVPEPETYAMLLAGLGMLGTIARRRQAAGEA